MPDGFKFVVVWLSIRNYSDRFKKLKNQVRSLKLKCHKCHNTAVHPESRGNHQDRHLVKLLKDLLNAMRAKVM